MEINYKNKYLKYKKKYLEFKETILEGGSRNDQKGVKELHNPTRRSKRVASIEKRKELKEKALEKKRDPAQQSRNLTPEQETSEAREAFNDIKFSIAGGLPFAILSAFYIDIHQQYSNFFVASVFKDKLKQIIDNYDPSFCDSENNKENLKRKIDEIMDIDNIHEKIFQESNSIGDLDTKLYHPNPIEPSPNEDIQFVLVRIKFGEGGELIDMGIPFNNKNPLNKNTHSSNNDIDKIKMELLHILIRGNPNDHKYDKRIRRLILIFFLENFLEHIGINEKNIIDIFSTILSYDEKVKMDTNRSNVSVISSDSKLSKLRRNISGYQYPVNTIQEEGEEQSDNYINDGLDEIIQSYYSPGKTKIPVTKKQIHIPRRNQDRPAPQKTYDGFAQKQFSPQASLFGIPRPMGPGFAPAPQQTVGYPPQKTSTYGPFYTNLYPYFPPAPQKTYGGSVVTNSLLLDINALTQHMSGQVQELNRLIDEFKLFNEDYPRGMIQYIQSARKKKVYYQIYNPGDAKQQEKLDIKEQQALHNLKSQKAIQTNLHICSLAFTDEEFNRFICPTHTEPTEYVDDGDLTVEELDEEQLDEEQDLVRVESDVSVSNEQEPVPGLERVPEIGEEDDIFLDDEEEEQSSTPKIAWDDLEPELSSGAPPPPPDPSPVPSKPYRTLIMNITSILNHMNTIKEDFIRTSYRDPTLSFNRASFNTKENIHSPNILTATVAEKLLEYPLVQNWIVRLQRLYNMHISDGSGTKIPLKPYSTWVAPNLKNTIEFEDAATIQSIVNNLIEGIKLTTNSLEFDN